MQKSKNQFLAISLILTLVLSSCASHKIVEGYALKPTTQQTYSAPYFSNPETDYVYKTNIAIYGNQISGIFIAKKITDDTHRVVFTTEFGNKLLDFEISPADFKVNSIVSELDRKIVINTLKNDFRLLLKKQHSIAEQYEDAENLVFKSPDGKQSNYLFVSKSNGKLLKIVQTSGRKEKINLSFTSESNIFAEQITITHYNIKLKIEFNHFKS